MLRTGLLLTALATAGVASSADAAVHTQTVVGSHTTTFASPTQNIGVTDGSMSVTTVTPSGVAGDLRSVRVRLKGVSHAKPDDLDVQLVSPSGHRVVLMSDAGGTSPVTDRDMLFTADAPPVPDESLPDMGGYGASDYDSGADTWGVTCTGSATRIDLAGLAHKAYQGQWKLCVADDAASGAGTIEGWELDLRTTGINAPGSGTSGAASAYPSFALVHGHSQPISDVRVTLAGAEHSAAADLDLLLVPPAGPAISLMSDAGLGGDLQGTLTFADAGSAMPTSGSIGSGTYRPSNYGPAAEFTPLPNDAPKPVTSLAALNGRSANGEWKLYATDDANGGIGAIESWSLDVTTGTPDPAPVPAPAAPSPVPAPAVIPAQPRTAQSVLPSQLVLAGLRASVKRGKVSAQFTLSAAAPATIRLERRSGKRFKHVTSTTARGRQGANTVGLKRKLKPGAYRLTVRAGGAQRTVAFRIRKGR